MAAIFGSNKTNATTPKYTGMQLQTSAYGIPIPVIYGTSRVGWNLADYVGFKSFATPSSSGGKGGVVGGGGKGSNSTSYSATVLGLISEGPVTGIFSSWISQTQSSGTPGFDIFLGAIAQTPWSYLSSNFPTHALTYSGFVYAGAENYALGTSANLPNVNWEVQGFFQGSAPGTYGGNGCVVGGDADPSLVIPDILSNPQYGIGFPASRIGQVVNNDEAHTIPGTGPFTVTVTNAADYNYNLNTTILAGIGLLYCTTGAPGPGYYSFNIATGVYTFNSAQAGAVVNIRYVSVTPALTNYQNFCLASGLWVSPAYTDQTQCSSNIDDLATATYSEVVWSSGIMQMIPRGTMPVTGNGHTYTPNTTPLFNLTEDDFMPNTGSAAGVTTSSSQQSGSGAGSSVTDDPVVVTRLRKSDQINDIKIECLDRANQYAPTVVEVVDMALIQKYGRRASATKALHLFCDVNAANTSAQLQLNDQYLLNTYCCQLDERYCILDPMDLVTLTDTQFPGMTDTAVRLLDLTENDDGTIVVTAEEYPGNLGLAAEYNIDVGSGYTQNFLVDPGDAAAPAIFAVPVQLVQTIGLEIWLATHSATGDPNWGGYYVNLSTDGTTYVKKGKVVGASRMGTLTSNFPSGADPDTVNTLAVNLSESLGVLEAGTTSDADTATTICFVDGEFLSYSTATLTSTYNYSMGTYIRRGQWGSAISAHSSGSLFVRLDDNVFSMPYTKADVGRTIHIKLTSFNIYNEAEQDLSSVTAYTYTIGQPPAIYAATGLSVVPTIKGNQLNWVNAANVGIAAMEIWRSASSSFSGATHIDDSGSYSTQYLDQNAASNTQYWYWVRPRDISGNEGEYDPSSGGAGATSTTGQVNTNDIANAAVTGAKIAAGAVTAILLAESLNVVQVVTTISLADPSVSSVAFNEADSQLYRYNGATWVTVVPAVNITGQIINAQIGAAAVEALQLGVGAVTTPAIFAGAVTASKVFIGSTSNILLDYMTSDLGYWTSGGYPNTLIVYNPGGGWTSPTAIQSSTLSSNYSTIRSPLIPCVAGDSFYAQLDAELDSGSATTIIGLLNWYDQLNGYLSSSGIGTITSTGTRQTVSSGGLVAPTSTCFVQFSLQTTGIDSSGPKNFTFASPICRLQYTGSLVVDGTITGINLNVSAITASGTIAALAVTAGTVDTNAITAGTLDVGAINASAIFVNGVVITASLGTNSVTNTLTAAVGAQQIPQSSFGYIGVGDCTITTTGGDVLIQFTDYTQRSNGHNPFYQYNVIRFDGSTNVTLNTTLAGGSSNGTYETIACGFYDTAPAAGTYQYYVEATQTGDTGAGFPISHSPFLTVTEVKR